MNNHNFIFEYFWVIAIIMAFVNGAFYKFRSLDFVQKNPNMAEECNRIILQFIFWLCLPWLVVGLGMMTGHVSGMFDYFRPGEGNPFVLAFFGCLILEQSLLAYWVFFRGGDITLNRHPWLFRGGSAFGPGWIKVQIAIGLVGTVVMFILLSAGVIHFPPIHP